MKKLLLIGLLCASVARAYGQADVVYNITPFAESWLADADTAAEGLALLGGISTATNLPNVIVTNAAAFLGPLNASSNVTVAAGATVYVYGAGSGTNNMERARISHDGAGTLTIAAEEAGTGTDTQDINLQPKGAGVVDVLGSLTVQTNLTVGQTIAASGGSASSMSISFGDGDTGFFERSDDYLRFHSAGNKTAEFHHTGIALRSTTPIGWGSTTEPTVANTDLFIKRSSAGVLGLADSTGTSGTGSLVASNVTANGYFAAGAQTGIAATVDVLVSDTTTNRLVFVGGILVSNITNYAP